MSKKQVLVLGIIMLLSSGCASFGRSLKAFMGGEERPKSAPAESIVGIDRDNMSEVPARQYGHMTRQKMEEEAQLSPRSGSLWSPEGQGAYLFSENRARLTGDLLNVKLDGAPKEQLQAKAKVISELLKKIDAPPVRGPAQAGAAGTPPAEAPKPEAKPAEGAAQASGEKPAEAAESDDAKSMNFEVIPTRVVERLNDGNYRVEGSQSFMIRQREYRVVVAGIIRAQDFNDEGVPATRILDPRFDIVSAKKGAR